MDDYRLEIKTGRWAWFGEEHGRLRTSPFRDLFADLARLEKHNPLLCLTLGAPQWTPSASRRDMRLTDLGLNVNPRELGAALERLPAGLNVVSRHFGRADAFLVLGRKGAAVGTDGSIDPKGRTVAASAVHKNIANLPCVQVHPYHTVKGPNDNAAQLYEKDNSESVLTALRASPLKNIQLWDIRPGFGKKEEKEEDDSRIGRYDAPDGCALTIMQKLDAKLKAALNGYGCEIFLRPEGKTEVERLDSVIAGTAPKFWLAEVRNAYMPPKRGLAKHLEETYSRLLKRKGSRFLYWRARRLAAACRRAGLDAPPRVIKGLARLRKSRSAETRKDD